LGDCPLAADQRANRGVGRHPAGPAGGRTALGRRPWSRRVDRRAACIPPRFNAQVAVPAARPESADRSMSPGTNPLLRPATARGRRRHDPGQRPVAASSAKARATERCRGAGGTPGAPPSATTGSGGSTLTAERGRLARSRPCHAALLDAAPGGTSEGMGVVCPEQGRAIRGSRPDDRDRRARPACRDLGAAARVLRSGTLFLYWVRGMVGGGDLGDEDAAGSRTTPKEGDGAGPVPSMPMGDNKPSWHEVAPIGATSTLVTAADENWSERGSGRDRRVWEEEWRG